MALSKIDINHVSLFPAARMGLNEKTATLTLEFDDNHTNWSSMNARLRDKVLQLCSAEPLWGIKENDWPKAFLILPDETATFANWVVALTIAFQRWARDPVWQGRVLKASKRSITLALPWQRDSVLKNALMFALRYLSFWTQTKPDPKVIAQLSKAFEQWTFSAQAGGLAPNTLRFAQAAHERDIPLSVSAGILRLGWGINTERMESSFTGTTGNLAVRIARHKFMTSQILQEGGVPVPLASLVPSWEDARKIADKFNWPVVIKPSNQDQGAGVVPGIRDEETLRLAFEGAAKFSPGAVVVEKHVEGEDHRLLVVGGKLLIATKRIPGGVTGDGTSTIVQLVAQVNADPRRGTGKRSLLIALTLDDEARSCLTEQAVTPESVPEAGSFVFLRRIANISAGGTATDITAMVHPDNRLVAERAARLIGLDIAGVDFLCPDISRSWHAVGGAVCEVNAQPGFRVHWLGDPARDINGEVIDWLFRDKTSRIPTAAITGTNGKGTVARMLHHIWMTAGKNAGVCTTDGVWVGHDLISDKNLSGYPGGRILLNDPSVEAAVIEMPRKGLIVFGHPCDHYDVAALLNLQHDHIGVDGIDSMEEMARLKAEVLERAQNAVVINAEDPLCLAMRDRALAPRHILVAREAEAPALREHLNQGGAGVFAKTHENSPWIILAEGGIETPLMPLAAIPATMNGLLRFNETNALFAVALAWAQGIAIDTIRRALAVFANTAEQNPGRYNFIEGLPFQVLLDFGHNPDGLRGICEIVQQLPVAGKRHFLSMMTGNRHRAHLDEIMPIVAPLFDDFILSCNQDTVLKSPEWAGEDPIQEMLSYSHLTLLAQGVSEKQITVERSSAQAIQLALASAQPGDLLVLLAGPWVALPILEEACRENTGR